MNLNDIQPLVVGGLLIEVNTPNMDLINDGLLGHYLPAQCQIGVRDDLPLQLQGNVLVHEVIHAIANVYCEGLGLNEAQVSGLAQGIYQVITDNDDFLEFITQINESIEDERPSVDTIMNGHVRSRGDDIAHSLAEAQANMVVSNVREYDKLGIDQGGH
jgi:hypothetical protein